MARNLPEEDWFVVYLLEHYAAHKGRKTGQVLREWDAHGITGEIYDGYFQYHQERLENAFADIDSLLATGRHAPVCATR
ncbi:MAG: DUF3791 domain-containing protein [Rhodocyclaceae bacterium]|nr:DUF3791 domain-containing protein [Rhodocyclaceae bacterium]